MNSSSRRENLKVGKRNVIRAFNVVVRDIAREEIVEKNGLDI